MDGYLIDKEQDIATTTKKVIDLVHLYEVKVVIFNIFAKQ